MQDLMRKLNASSLTLFSIIFFFSSSLIELKLRNPNPSGSSFFCSALSPDGLSLLAFKSAVSADPGSSLADWNEDDEDPCRWPGISCANISGYSFPRVVAVSVSGKNLSGYIPSELGTLIFLRRLNLHGNFLSGPIPPQLSNASSLHSIFLYSNNLSGSLPPSLCNLPRLQNLDLSGNALSGQIPADLRNCRDLQRLLLSRNRFSGEIPAGIWPELGNLVQLDLSSNSFNGSISWDLGDLKSLSGVLNLSHNQFSGEIPTDLGKLPAAVSLDLRGNDLSGEIPQVGALTNQGPTAFLGNPNLCGFPLQNPCKNLSPAPPGAQIPGTPPPGGGSKKGGLRPGLIILISVADAVGVALVGLILVYVYWKLKDHSRGVGCSCTGKTKLGGREEGFFCCSCSWKELLLWSTTKFESSNNSSDEAEDSEKGGGEGDLVSIDKGFSFELDELLRASAYVLGKSGLGIVYKVVLGNGIPVAVRRLGEGGAQRYKEFAAEIQAIGKVRHPNIVRLRAYYWAPDEKLLISDFISNGNLGSALRGRSGQPSLSWALRLKISKRTARGLAYLHECSPRKFVHGDIKPSNILLDADFNPYVSDFGLIRLISITGNSAASTAGFMGGVLPSAATKPATAPPPLERPNNYRAPEARSPGVNRPTQKWDVYSFGLVLLELLTGKSPEFSAPSPASSSSSPLGAPSTSTSELVRWVRKGFEQENPLSEMVDPALLQEVQAKKEVVLVFHVALACTEADPEARPRMKTICENLERIGS